MNIYLAYLSGLFYSTPLFIITGIFISMDKRYLQANKEARFSLYITVIYLIVWIFSAYLFGNNSGILGFPVWFELSCIFTPIGFVLICYLIVKWQFRDIPLDNAAPEHFANK